MANFDSDHTFIFPVFNGSTNTLRPTVANTMSYIPNDIMRLTSNNSAVFENSHIRLQRFGTGDSGALPATVRTDDSAAYTFEDCFVELTANNETQAVEGQRGTNVFRNSTFIHDNTATSGRLLIGRGTAANRANAKHTYDNVQFIGNNSGCGLTFLTSGLSLDDLVFENVSFLGAAVAEFIHGVPADRTTWSGSGSTAQSPAGTAYAIRVTQHGPDGNDMNGTGYSGPNVPSSGIGLPNHAYQIFNQNDFSNTTTAGDSLAGAGRQSVAMFNRQASVWFINPILGETSGTARQLRLTSHTGNAPSSTQRMETRTFIAWRPIFRDRANSTIIISDATVVVSGTNNLFEVPASYAPGTIPTPLTGNRAVINSANHNGLWIEDRHVTYVAQPTNTDAQRVHQTSQKTWRVWSFTHDVTHLHTNGLPTFEVTNGAGETQNIIGSNATGIVSYEEETYNGDDLGDYLNSRSEGDTAINSSATLSNMDDIYPAMRQDWYSDRVEEAFQITGSNANRITFNTTTTFSGGTNNYTTTQLNINADTSLTATNITEYAAGPSVTVSTGTRTLPSNITLISTASSATWNLNNATLTDGITLDGNFTNVTGGQLNGLTIEDGSTVEILGSSTTLTLDEVTLNGGVTLSATSATTVQVPAAQLPTAVGTNKFAAGTNVTIEQIPAGVVNLDHVVPAQNGYFGVYNKTKDSEEIPARRITSASPIADRRWRHSSTDSDNYRVYWRPDNTATEGYYTTVEDADWSEIPATDAVDNIPNTNVPDALWSGTSRAGTSVSVTEITDAGDSDNNQGVECAFGTAGRANNRESHYLILQCQNSEHYMKAMVLNNLTKDILEPESNEEVAVNWNYVRFNTDSDNVQQQLTGVIGYNGSTADVVAVTNDTGTAGLTGDTVLIFPNPSGLSQSGAQAAAAEALENSADIGDIKRGVGYMVTDGDNTNPVNRGSKLNGIKPKKADYDPNGTYGDEL